MLSLSWLFSPTFDIEKSSHRSPKIGPFDVNYAEIFSSISRDVSIISLHGGSVQENPAYFYDEVGNHWFSARGRRVGGNCISEDKNRIPHDEVSSTALTQSTIQMNTENHSQMKRPPYKHRNKNNWKTIKLLRNGRKSIVFSSKMSWHKSMTLDP